MRAQRRESGIAAPSCLALVDQGEGPAPYGVGDRGRLAVVQSLLGSTLYKRPVDGGVARLQVHRLDGPSCDQCFQSLPGSVPPGPAFGKLIANIGRHQEAVREGTDDGARCSRRDKVDDHARIGHDRKMRVTGKAWQSQTDQHASPSLAAISIPSSVIR